MGEVSRTNEATITNNTQDSANSIETDIDINNISLVNRIYRKYVKNPKEPEVGGEEIDLEILLIN